MTCCPLYYQNNFILSKAHVILLDIVNKYTIYIILYYYTIYYINNNYTILYYILYNVLYYKSRATTSRLPQEGIGLANAGSYLGEEFGHTMRIVWALGLCAAGQSSTMTGAYAGQWVPWRCVADGGTMVEAVGKCGKTHRKTIGIMGKP